MVNIIPLSKYFSDILLEESNSNNKKVIFCTCGSEKNPDSKKQPVKAEELYIGELSKKSMEYAKKQYSEYPIYILSAKYGVLPLNKKIKYYDTYLGNFSKEQLEEWRNMVYNQLNSKGYSLEDTKFIFLTGSSYYEPFTKDESKKMKHIQTPMEDCEGLGYMIQWLNDRI